MMWMMGYTDAGDFDTIQDPFTGRKLRPLVPRPAAAAASTTPSPCLNPIHSTDLLALNHHLVMAAEHNKRDLTNTQQVVVSSRWNPTPEQLQTLEELYRSGTRTPSADQIQHITAQLRKYGKIEGKNVFYWFQNHKARERQKRRRQQLESLSDEAQIANSNSQTQNGEKKELPPGPNKTAFEVEQTKNWASPTNSSTIAEKTVCTQGGAAETEAEAGDAECKAASAAVDGGGGRGGWQQLDIDDAELYQRRNATWQMMHLSCSSSSPTNLIMPSSSSSALTVTSPIIIPSKQQQQQQQTHPHHQLDFVNIFGKPYNPTHHQILHDYHLVAPNGGGVAQTLELFPLESSGGLANRCTANLEEEEEDADIGGMNSAADHVAPYQFFEFLPLKN